MTCENYLKFNLKCHGRQSTNGSSSILIWLYLLAVFVPQRLSS